LPDHAPSTGTEYSHCGYKNYWDIIGPKCVGLIVDGKDEIHGMEAGKTDKIPVFVSRAEGSGDEIKTRYFMIADKKYTPHNLKKEINEDLDKYWFNEKKTHKVPQTDLVFDKGGNHHKKGKLKIEFANYRAFKKKVFDDKVISSKAKLYICLFDLDDDLEEDKEEKVRVLINGKNAGEDGILRRSRDEVFLKSVISNPDSKWQIYELEFDTKLLKFPKLAKKDNYPEPEINTVELELDMNNKGWALEVDWAVISYDAISPTFLIHGANQDESFWEGYILGLISKNWVGDTDFIKAFKKHKMPFDYKISIQGVGEERDKVGGATILEGGDEIIKKLPGLCKKHGTFSYNIVAHSKGGLWFRDALPKIAVDEKLKYLSLCHFITLSTPHCGSVLADYLQALYKESKFQDGKEEKYLETSGTVPAYYETVRALYWPSDPAKVLKGSAEEQKYYYNDSASDLGAKYVNEFNKVNAVKLKEYKNFDETIPKFYALTADADNNNNNVIDSGPFLSLYDEWFPLQKVFDVLNPGATYEEFFNCVYWILNSEICFESEVRDGKIHFSNRYVYFGELGNDLFVNTESGKGNPLNAPAPKTLLLSTIFTHIPQSTWWNTNEPDATNHGTICAKEVGEFLLGENRESKEYIKSLR